MEAADNALPSFSLLASLLDMFMFDSFTSCPSLSFADQTNFEIKTRFSKFKLLWIKEELRHDDDDDVAQARVHDGGDATSMRIT